MIEICLASAPTITELGSVDRAWGEEQRRVPLGTLALAAALEREGLRPRVLHLDELYAGWIGSGRQRAAFAGHAARELAARNADVYGLGSICNSYPLTLRIAGALRRLRPACRIVLGGPQATATDRETLAAFPAVDLVLRGECDASLPELVRAIERGVAPGEVRGVTYRRGREVLRAPDAPVVEDLDSLPLPAYHLCSSSGRGRSLLLEVGRGCPFACSFCSTSRFFGRRFRMRSPERVVEDMRLLASRYGVRRFELVHDNFTVDRRKVLAFCRAVKASGARLAWSCSSRTDAVDAELLGEMKAAGCDAIFYGVESGSAAVQRAIGKGLDVARVRERLRATARRRIHAVVGFMAGFPEETRGELGETVDLFLDTLRSELLEPQVSLLSPLSGTPVYERHREDLVLDEFPSDIAFQGLEQLPADRELIARHREVFSSFYAVPAPALDRRELYELRCFLIACRHDLRWLVVFAGRVAGGGLALFEAFQAWRPTGARGRSYQETRVYYRGGAFRRDLVRFVRDHLADRAGAEKGALRALAKLTADLHPGADSSRGRRARAGRAPRLAPGLTVSRIGYDGAALVRTARRAGDLSRVPRLESVLVARHRRGRLEVLRLSPAAADLLQLCDGRRDRGAIARAFGRRHPEVAGEAACAVGLAALIRRGLVVAKASRKSLTGSA